MAEPGWYHAEGDPEGTVRLWNGEAWVGFPQRDPNIAREAAKIELGPARGQQRMWPFAMLACLGLLVPAGAYAFQTWALFQDWQLIRELQTDTVLDLYVNGIEPTENAARHGLALIWIGVGVLVAGPPFILWMWAAYKNIGRWTRTRYETWWGVISWFVPFINLKRPAAIMHELVEGSPRKDRTGEINPVIAWSWWILFISGGLASRMLIFWALRASGTRQIQLILEVAMGLSILQVVACVLAMRLVGQISVHQDSRFDRVTMEADHIGLARV